MKKHDIIPDLHGDYNRLVQIFKGLGYMQGPGYLWIPPRGREAIFLGDFIDGGKENEKVLETVSAMISMGFARGILGNHELNAILFHSEGRLGGPLRKHGPVEIAQHESFIQEFGIGTPKAMRWVKWFMTLPLFLEGDKFRAVHAYWSQDQIDLIRARRPDGKLKTADLEEIAVGTGGFANAVLDMVKGPEIALPEGYGFEDGNGHWRDKGRYRWWGGLPDTWGDALASVDLQKAKLPAGSPEGILHANYPHDAKPLFIGHYKKRGLAIPEAENVICLDHPDRPVVYRHDGEKLMNPENILDFDPPQIEPEWEPQWAAQ